MQLVAQLLDSTQARARELARRLDTASADLISEVAMLLRRWPDSTETAVQLYRSLDRGRHYNRVPLADSLRVQRWRFRVLSLRGHLREAYGRAREQAAEWSPADYVQLVMLGIVPPDVGDATFRQWLRDGDVRRAMLALSWWAERRDAAAMQTFLRQSDSLVGTASAAAPVADIRLYGVAAARGYLALLRGDTADAIRRFAELPDSLCESEWCSADWLIRARLLATRGRERDAAAMLDQHPPILDYASILEPLWTLERARLAERIGDRDEAIEHYTFVADLWMHADSEVQRAVAEANTALQRLHVGRPREALSVSATGP